MSFPTSILKSGSSEYSALLKPLVGHPEQLYIQGNAKLLNTACVAIIGAREITSYGRQVIEVLVPGLVRVGLTIVSGLAYGVDAAAHHVALKHGGDCIMVLGSGFDRVYPAANLGLFTSVLKKGGCAVSEYAPGVGAKPYHFPARNRIIAGLSQVTVIIEAGENSGTLITARQALDAGREVAVVPADITRTKGQGVNRLLKEGATPVTCTEDILRLFPEPFETVIPPVFQPALTGSPATLYDLISHGVEETEGLVAQSGLELSDVQSVLSVLELDGYIISNRNRWQKIS